MRVSDENSFWSRNTSMEFNQMCIFWGSTIASCAATVAEQSDNTRTALEPLLALYSSTTRQTKEGKERKKGGKKRKKGKRKEKKLSTRGIAGREDVALPFVLDCEGAIQLVQRSSEQAFSKYGFRMCSSVMLISKE
jgi:hypothetical protein